MFEILCQSSHCIFFGGVFVCLEHLDSVPTAELLNLPHCQVSEFLRSKSTA